MIWGWDVSTAIIGLSLLDETGSHAHFDFLDLRTTKVFSDKTLKVREFIRDCISSAALPMNVHKHFVEDRLGGFTRGKTRRQTLMTLAAINAVVSYIIRDEFTDVGLDVTVSHIHPSRVKSIMRKRGLFIPKGGDKKAWTLNWVRTKEPSFPMKLNRNGKPQPWCFDQADAYCIAMAGWSTLNEQR